MIKRAAFHTLGCKVNAYETEAMQEMLRARGYEIVPFEPGADVYIINTCTVTGIADKKSRQMLHRAKEMNPDALVVACGCYAEDAGKKLLEDSAVDLIAGNAAKSELADIIDRWISGRDPAHRSFGTPIERVKDYDDLRISDTEERTRAYIKIQDGCNQFCTYCAIPYVRGRARSRDREEILAETARLSSRGFREIVLTGIHISSYGYDFEYPGENRQTPFAKNAVTNRRLLDLIREMAEVTGIERIRLGSLEPGIMTEEFIEGLSRIPEICPQFHLSLQSGSDGVLIRMGRKYRTSDYRNICRTIRRYFPEAAITTDIITGFPGESEKEFEETRAFVDEIRFAKTHIFKYSRREGTKAASMPCQVPEELKRERSAVLIEADRKNRHAYAASFLGKETEVLFEEKDAEEGCWTGHTREALDVIARSSECLEGKILTCLAEDVREDGTLIVRVLQR